MLKVVFETNKLPGLSFAVVKLPVKKKDYVPDTVHAKVPGYSIYLTITKRVRHPQVLLNDAAEIFLDEVIKPQPSYYKRYLDRP